jgi:hypothetical protein
MGVGLPVADRSAAHCSTLPVWKLCIYDTTIKHLCSDGVLDFSNEYFVIRIYSGSLGMSSNHTPSVATVLSDIISLSVAIMIIW